jgi:hypothetical protein
MDIYAELGDIVAGEKPGRETNTENILCAPIGMGSEDVATAYRVYKLAQEKGLGQKLRWLLKLTFVALTEVTVWVSIQSVGCRFNFQTLPPSVI